LAVLLSFSTRGYAYRRVDLDRIFDHRQRPTIPYKASVDNIDEEITVRRRLEEVVVDPQSFLVQSLPLLKDDMFKTRHWAGELPHFSFVDQNIPLLPYDLLVKQATSRRLS